MAGTTEGGKAAAETNKKRYGDDFYKRLGTVGGKNGHTGGFAVKKICKKKDCPYAGLFEHKPAQCAGAIGGTLSRRPKTVKTDKPKSVRPATAVSITRPKPASQPLVRLSAAARERIEADKARRIDVRSA